MKTSTLVINFSHPLTQLNEVEIKKAIGRDIEVHAPIKVHLDLSNDPEQQIIDIFEQILVDWHSINYIVNLPGHSIAAALVLAEIAGRAGRLPTVLVMVPNHSITGVTYTVASVLDLDVLKQAAANMM